VEEGGREVVRPFLSVLLPTSLPPPSSSLLISLLALLFLLPLSLLPLIPAHCLSPSFLSILLPTTSPSFLSIHFITISLPPSSESSSPPPSSQSSFSLPLSLLPLASSSLPLSFLPLNPPHYFSPSFLSLLLTTSLPPSSPNEGWRGGEDDWEEGGREVVRVTERKEGER
jgi:hypothetical protein